MHDTNLTEWVLDTLASNWAGDAGAPMRPVLLNGDDSTIHTLPENGNSSKSAGDKAVEWDLTISNTITVSAGTTTNTPVGGEYDHRVTTTLDVRIEGAAGGDDEFGHVAGDDAWDELVREVMRALLAERNYPVPGEYHTLALPDQDAGLATHADYYRTDLTAEFRGYSDLP